MQSVRAGAVRGVAAHVVGEHPIEIESVELPVAVLLDGGDADVPDALAGHVDADL